MLGHSCADIAQYAIAPSTLTAACALNAESKRYNFDDCDEFSKPTLKSCREFGIFPQPSC
jgi:hypothetical protein